MFEGEKFESRKNKDRENISGVKKKSEKYNGEGQDVITTLER